MNPVRLVILAVLFYIAWRLIGSLWKDRNAGTNDNRREDTAEVRDVLVEDPVCHTLIPKGQAIRLRSHGKTYYFCSEECCDTFTRESGGDK